MVQTDSNSKRTRKAPRKSRSRGLRTKTGCITCRQRHKKCKEAFPVCGNCALANRDCLWSNKHPVTASTVPQPQSREDVVIDPNLDRDIATSFDNGSGSGMASSEYESTHVSPSTSIGSEFLTAELASIRWLDLLAEDAVQANRGFTLPPSPTFEPQSEPFLNVVTVGSDGIKENGNTLDESVSNDLLGSDRQHWRSEGDVELNDSEIMIFQNFVERAARWLDLFDPNRHFSAYTTRLALRNVGLMKAILALSAQHLSRQGYICPIPAINDPNIAVQYYFETLHYVKKALQYNSYAQSEELLATVLIISTYEMLDESQSEWQRHLKGVFWIQRSQNVNGASGGIRQAVWWAWLRQDVWAAFRERRRCFSFWKPVADYPDLSKPELIERIVYLFSQAVNFCAEQTDLSNLESAQQKMKRADRLLEMLDGWRHFLAGEFKTLPVARTGTVFRPIWIHPPELGVALQVFHFARILITLHRPAVPGFDSHMKVQKSLCDAVAVIVGIAMYLSDDGCQIISAQCLFGAGLCVQDPTQRDEIISLIRTCEARTNWPLASLCNGLYEEWKKLDSADGSLEI